MRLHMRINEWSFDSEDIDEGKGTFVCFFLLQRYALAALYHYARRVLKMEPADMRKADVR